MTDEQIIKAVEEREDVITSMCDDCKYVKYSFDGGSTKCGYRGKKDCNFIPREKKDLAKEDFESIKETIISNLDNETKSEAIKEFAERLKRYSFVDNLSLDGKETVYIDDIDNLVKEMTEGKE